jgi:hypothetical protein
LGLASSSSSNWVLLSNTTGAGNQYQLKNVGSVLDFQQDLIQLTVKGIVLGGPTLISGNITYLPGINTLLSPPAPNASQGNATTVDDNALTALTVTPPLSASNTFTAIACNGGTSVVTVTGIGGTPPYSGVGTFTVTAGTHIFPVTDVFGVIANTTAIITEPAPLTGSSVVTACNSATLMGYANNPVLTTGAYPVTYVNVAGCDSVHTFNVTINTGTFNATTATACNTYTWLANGTSYTASGTYTHSYINANGCASVDTLHLTINTGTFNATTAAACNSYTWAANGVTYNTSGTNTYAYTNINGCASVDTLHLTINTPTSSNVTLSAVGNYLWPINGVNYTSSGTYTNVGVNAAGCAHNDTLILTIIPPTVLVSARAMLAGPYLASAGLMRDDLRTKNLIPSAQPYGVAPYVAGFTHVGGGMETVSAAVLAVSGNDAIVDWVFVSLRSAANPATIVQTQAALIQRDGDIVSAADGVSPVTFAAMPGYYFVAVDHRNHLGIVTADSFALSATTTAMNLSNGSTALHVNATSNNPSPLTGATKNIGGVRALYAGNCNIANILASKQVNYGPAPTTDRAALFTATGGTATINAYTIFDVDMNGFARYNGLNPDRAIISSTVNNSNTIIAHEQQP